MNSGTPEVLNRFDSTLRLANGTHSQFSEISLSLTQHALFLFVFCFMYENYFKTANLSVCISPQNGLSYFIVAGLIAL